MLPAPLHVIHCTLKSYSYFFILLMVPPSGGMGVYLEKTLYKVTFGARAPRGLLHLLVIYSAGGGNTLRSLTQPLIE